MDCYKGGHKMKKVWAVSSALALSLALGACSGGGDQSSEKEQDTAASTAEQTNPKKALVRFYMDLTNQINEQDVDLNTYVNTEEKTDELKTAAAQSASTVAEGLKKVEIPADLKEQKEDIEAALKDFSTSYELKAEELKKGEPSFEEADQTFLTGQEKLGTVFESVELLKPDLSKEVN
jgi:hypothetical protein